jgi:hypothetical protein
MKCVRTVGQGVPIRMTDAEARQWVERDHDGEYCKKRFWREWWSNETHRGSWPNAGSQGYSRLAAANIGGGPQ